VLQARTFRIGIARQIGAVSILTDRRFENHCRRTVGTRGDRLPPRPRIRPAA
jgi:hypothetical protein